MYGTSTERAIKYAQDSCVRRARVMVVWRNADRVGVTTELPEGATLIGTAHYNEARGVARWEPAA